MRSRRRTTVLCTIAALATLTAACGDDPSDAVGAGSEAPVEDLASTLPPAGGTGSGTVVVDSRSYGFEADVCALTPVSHKGSAYDLYVHGEGVSGNDSFEIEVVRTAGDDGSRIETVLLSMPDNRIITANNVVPTGQTQDRLAVSDTLLSGEIEFVTTGDSDAVSGRVDVTCS